MKPNDPTNIQDKRCETKRIVQELLKQRRLEKNIPSNEILDSKIPTEPTFHKMYQTDGFSYEMQRKSIDFSQTLSTFTQYKNTISKMSVFERLTQNNNTKRLDPGNTKSPKKSHHKNNLTELNLHLSMTMNSQRQNSTSRSEQVADRLINYRKEKDEKLQKKRAEKQLLEMSTLQNTPRINQNSTFLSQSKFQLFQSYTDRFKDAEEKRRKRLQQKTLILEENQLKTITSSPKVFFYLSNF